MALIKCPECGKEISDQAATCPNCGNPLKKEGKEQTNVTANLNERYHTPPKKKKGRGCLMPFLIVVFFLGMLGAIIAGAVQQEGGKSKNNTADVKITKEDAGTLDDEVWKRVTNTVNTYNEILKGMDGYSNGTVSALDLYNYCKKADEYLGKISVSYPKNDDEDIAPYIRSCVTYTLYVQSVAKSLAEYIDAPKTSKLSKVDDCIDDAHEALLVVAGNRGVFLTKMGFSEEEVEAIVNEIEEEFE